MLLRLFLLLTLMPIIELYLLTQFSLNFGLPTTILMILMTGFVGATLSKQQGTQALHEIRRQMSLGQMPTDALVDGCMIFVAGVLLVTPGVLTDLLGILMLIPVFRRVIRYWLVAELKKHTVIQVQQFGTSFHASMSSSSSSTSSHRHSADQPIDVEFERHRDPPITGPSADDSHGNGH